MSETDSKTTTDESDSIDESVDRLHDLQGEIRSVRERKQDKLTERKRDKQRKPFRKGTIVPRPDDREGSKTGVVRDGEVCIWISDSLTEESFCEWISYPQNEKQYSERNEYVRLCLSTGVDIQKPQDLLYEEVPIKESESLSTDIPELGRKTSVARNTVARKVKNLNHSFLQSSHLRSITTLLLSGIVLLTLSTSWPARIPFNKQQSIELGYSPGVGLALCMTFCIVMIILVMLNVILINQEIIPKIAKGYEESVARFNGLTDGEYSNLRE